MTARSRNRLPGRHHIGDGVYAGHDGYQFILETSDGISVTNRVALDEDTLDGLQKYLLYARGFYQSGQHQVSPDCEDCGADITANGPIPGAISAEIYRVEHQGAIHEIRLCPECARTVDQALLQGIILKRPDVQAG